jgi:hypothetical protein
MRDGFYYNISVHGEERFECARLHKKNVGGSVVGKIWIGGEMRHAGARGEKLFAQYLASRRKSAREKRRGAGAFLRHHANPKPAIA